MQDEARPHGSADATQGSVAPTPQNAEIGRSKPRWLLPAAILMLAAAAIAFWFWRESRLYESTDDAFIDAQIVHIAPQVAGVIETIAVAPNRHVNAGDLLVTIDPDTTAAQLSQQQAGLEQGEAQTGEARAGLAAAEAALAQATAEVRAQEALAARARRDLERLTAAQASDPAAIAATQLDAARAQLQAAQAAVASARSVANAARAQIDSARQGIGSAEAQRRAAAARVSQARLSFDQNRITAPLSGHVTNIAVNKGSYVAPGTQMMALVPDDLWVTANFKETQLADIRPGQPVTIEIDAYPGVTFTGRVDSIQRGAGQAFQLFPPQNATGNFIKVVQRVPVRITFDRIDLKRYPIGPGMSVVPTIKVR